MVYPRSVADVIQAPMNTREMTSEEFRERIRKLLGVPEGAGKRSDKCVVRKASDRGYYPPARKVKGKKR